MVPILTHLKKNSQLIFYEFGGAVSYLRTFYDSIPPVLEMISVGTSESTHVYFDIAFVSIVIFPLTLPADLSFLGLPSSFGLIVSFYIMLTIAILFFVDVKDYEPILNEFTPGIGDVTGRFIFPEFEHINDVEEPLFFLSHINSMFCQCMST